MGTKNGNKFASTIVGVTNVLGIAKILFFLTVLIIDVCKMLGVGSVLRTVVGKSLNNWGIISGYAYAGVGFSALSFGFTWLFLLFEIVMLLIPFVLSLIEVLMGVRALRLYSEDGIIKHLNRNLWLKILFNGFLAFMISVFELSDWVLAFECLCVMIPFLGFLREGI